MERSIDGGEKLKYRVYSHVDFNNYDAAVLYAADLYRLMGTPSGIHALGSVWYDSNGDKLEIPVEFQYPQPQQQNNHIHKKSHTT